MAENKEQWRMKCYYCLQYECGTCPYKNRKVVPKKCRHFAPPLCPPSEFSGLEKVVIAIMILIVAPLLMLYIAGLIFAVLQA